jgi:hypothetical protein
MSYASEALHACLTQRTQRKEEKDGEAWEWIGPQPPQIRVARFAVKTNFILQTHVSSPPNSLGFSSFLCVLCVESLASQPGKSFNTEDTEKRGEKRRERRA